MKRLSLILLVVLLIAAEPAEEAKKDLAKLQGQWEMAALEVDGQLVPAEKLQGTLLTVKGDQYTVAVKDTKHGVTITLDPGQNPKSIDMAFPDGPNAPKIGKGIYKIEEDKFVVCRAQSTDGERPTQFGTWPNTGVFQVTWQRKAK
ncbi:MAG: TIGR03067 domain-containing protein [Gemmataceae bacterium]